MTFNFYDFDNNDVFYTDSNGLEMQQRKIDFRPDWTLETNETIASNYYPINSAISMIDPYRNLQVTICNDRAQGGSVIEQGTIEFMHNRRMFYDDSRGVGEALNETDSFGNGISVPAKYKVQAFNRSISRNEQRNLQLQIDEPPQYFFSFNYTLGTKTSFEKPVNLHEVMLEANLTNSTGIPKKIEMFPVARNVILVRFENLADKFDGPINKSTPNDTTYSIDVKAFATVLWTKINPGAFLNDLNIMETTLTGNQNYKTMMANKVQWRGLDDANVTAPVDPQDQPGFVVALQPQRIRTFVIEYVPFSQDDLIVQ